MIQMTEMPAADNIRDSVSVMDGKYTFLTLKDCWKVYVLRYNEPWLVIEAGHNAVAACFRELEQAREALSEASNR